MPLIGLSLAYLWGWIIAVPYQAAIQYEGHMLWCSWKLGTGANIYAAGLPVQSPWWVSVYPPLYFALGAALTSMFGAEFWCLRIWSVLSAVICCFFFYRIISLTASSPASDSSSNQSGAAKMDRLLPLVGVVLLLSFRPFEYWSAVARSDINALMFSLWALERFIVGEKFDSEAGWKLSRNTWISMALFLVSCLSRQTMFVFPAAACLYLLMEKKIKKAFACGFVFAAGLGTATGLLQLATGGYLHHLGFLRNEKWHQDIFLQTTIICAAKNLYNVCVLPLLMLMALFLNLKIESFERIAYALLALCVVTEAYICGLPGIDDNHFIVAGFAVVWWLTMKAGKLKPWFTTVLIVAAAGGLPFLHYWSLAHSPDLSPVRGLSAENKVVLVEDPQFAIESRSIPELVDSATLMHVWQEGSPQVHQIIDRINKHEYPYVQLNRYDWDTGGGLMIWPASIIEALKKHYHSVDGPNFADHKQKLLVPNDDVEDPASSA